VVSNLILGGINQHIQTGDSFGLWTFAELVNKNAYGPKMWVAEERMQHANRAFRAVHDAKFSRTAGMERVVAGIKQAAKESGALTVFLVTDGSAPLNGTPFDAAINGIFQKHAPALRKARRPFVVTMTAEDGELVAHAVSPAGSRVFIPPRKKPAADLVSDDEVFGIKHPPESQTPQTPHTNAPKPLTVAEISDSIKKQQAARSNALAAAAATDLSNSNATSVQTQTAGQSATVTNASSAPAADRQQRVPIDTPPIEQTSVESNSLAAVDGGDARIRGQPENVKRPEQNIAPGNSSQLQTQATAGPSPVSGARPETFAAVAPMDMEGSRRYLIMAALFFGFAVVLGWVLFRLRHPRVSPSLITRSLRETDRK